jgi:hypothetical protein
LINPPVLNLIGCISVYFFWEVFTVQQLFAFLGQYFDVVLLLSHGHLFQTAVVSLPVATYDLGVSLSLPTLLYLLHEFCT